MSRDAVQAQAREVAGGRRRLWDPIIVIGVVAGLLLLLEGAWLVGSYFSTRPAGHDASSDAATGKWVPRPLFSFPGVANPAGVAIGPTGEHVYVAEAGGDRLLRVFGRDGNALGNANPPDTNRTSRWPSRLAVDPGGRIYVVDRTRAVVDVYTPDLKWNQAWRPIVIAARDGWRPEGVSAGPDGRIYVTQVEGSDPSVLVFDPAGRLLDRLSKGMGLAITLRNPIQAVADDEGRVYIADGDPGRLVVVGSRGSIQVVDRVGSAAMNPRGLATGGGLLFVADAASQQVLVFSQGDQPDYLGAFGKTDRGDRLGFPSGIAVSANGRVFVSDWLNHRVLVYTY